MNKKKKKQYEQLELQDGSIEDIGVNNESQNSDKDEEASARLNAVQDKQEHPSKGNTASLCESDAKDIGTESLANVNSQTKLNLEFQSPRTKAFGIYQDYEDDQGSCTQMSSRALTNKLIDTQRKEDNKGQKNKENLECVQISSSMNFKLLGGNKNKNFLSIKETNPIDQIISEKESEPQSHSMREHPSLSVTPDKKEQAKNYAQTSENSSSVKKAHYIEQARKQSAMATPKSNVNQFEDDNMIGNTEQKENKAKGDKMAQIIDMQMEAQFQKSINKIRQGTLKNTMDRRYNQASAPMDFNKHQQDGFNLVSRFQDEDDQSLRQFSKQSFSQNARNFSNVNSSRLENVLEDQIRNQRSGSEISSPFGGIQAPESQNGGFSNMVSRRTNGQNLNFEDSTNIVNADEIHLAFQNAKPPVGPSLRQNSIHLSGKNMNLKNLKFQNNLKSTAQNQSNRLNDSSLGSINRKDLDDAENFNQSIHSMASKAEERAKQMKLSLQISRQYSMKNRSQGNSEKPNYIDPGAPNTNKNSAIKIDSQNVSVNQFNFLPAQSQNPSPPGYTRIQVDEDFEERQSALDINDRQIDPNQIQTSKVVSRTNFDQILENQNLLSVFNQTGEQTSNRIWQGSFTGNHRGSIIKSAISGPTYMSEDIRQSLQIDEQIATHESYLQELKKQREQMMNAKQNEPICKYPQVYEGPPPSQTMRGDTSQNQTQRSILNTFGHNQSGINYEQNIGNSQASSPLKLDVESIPLKFQEHQEEELKQQRITESLQPKPKNQFTERNSTRQKLLSQSPTINDRAHHSKRLSKFEAIKKEKKEKTKKERLIRQFNLKMIDKVIYELKESGFDLQNSRLKPVAEEGNQEEQQASLSSSEQKLQDELEDARRLGSFLYEAKGIDKQMAGWYFGEDKKLNQKVCKEFMKCFSFKAIPVDSCWRIILNKTGLPKEGQQITRVIGNFEEVYLEQNKHNLQINSWQPDTVWLLSVTLMDLNTNLHNPNVPVMLKYSKETFVENCMKYPAIKQAFSEQQISEMYDRISKQEFEGKVSLHERYFKRINQFSYALFQQANDVNIQDSNQLNTSQVIQNKENWRISKQKSILTKKQSIVGHQKMRQQILEKENKTFKEPGTIFTKYGRIGKPKQRLVFLNDEETEIQWRDWQDKNEKPRRMPIKEIESIQIGSEHTQIMRNAKIPMRFDNFCISIIAKYRSLDLYLQEDSEVIQMWQQKLEKIKNQDQLNNEDISSNRNAFENLQMQNEQDLHIFQRDRIPECLEYIWQNEILNNLQRYWNPLVRELYHDVELYFPEEAFKQTIVNHINENGGFFKHLNKEQIENNKQTDFSYQRFHGMGLHNHSIIRRTTEPKNTNAMCSPGFGRFNQFFSNSSTKTRQKSKDTSHLQQETSFLDKLWSRNENLVTLDQIWYRGLPNLARVCLWPILIGNQLQLNRNIYQSVSLQVESITKKAIQLQNNQAQGRLSLGSMDLQHANQLPNLHRAQVRQTVGRHSHLTSIVSERDKEIIAEQSSILDPSPNDHGTEFMQLQPQSSLIPVKQDPNFGIMLKKVQSSQTQNSNTGHFSHVETPGGEHDGEEFGDFEVAATARQNQLNMDVDIFTEQMIMQFYKIQRKVGKICLHWESASIIGEMAEIPTEIFSKVMNDVLAAFLIHKANINGIQSAVQNFTDVDYRNADELEAIQKKCNFDAANYVPGLEKVLAPLVLIFMRDQESNLTNPAFIEQLTSQVFISYTNLMLSSSGSGNEGSQSSIHFLKHFITDDIAQIEWRMDFFDKLFLKVLPQLHNQFQGINLKSEFFLHGWMNDMFVNVQGLEGLEFVLRIWDFYLLHGEPIIYCVAISILKSKLFKLNHAPMQTWLDFFSKIKKLKIPQQSQFYHYHLGLDRSAQGHQSQESQGGQEGGEGNDQGFLGEISNKDSKNLIPLMQDAIKIYIDFNVDALFKDHQLQQMIAEQKNEIFTKVYFNDNFQ